MIAVRLLVARELAPRLPSIGPSGASPESCPSRASACGPNCDDRNDHDTRSGGLQQRLRLKAVEAYEHVDHSAICQAELVVDRVQLCVERHRLAARTRRNVAGLNEVRLATELMPPTDVAPCPLERRESSGFVTQRLSRQPEWRNRSQICPL